MRRNRMFKLITLILLIIIQHEVNTQKTDVNIFPYLFGSTDKFIIENNTETATNEKNDEVTTAEMTLATSDNQNSSVFERSFSPSSYLEFRIGSAVNLYSPPVITVIGTVGNALTIAILAKSKTKLTSPELYMLALAIADSLMIWIGLFQYWCLFNFAPFLITSPHCHAMFFVVNFVNNYAVWIIVAMTIERFIAVYFPLKAPSWLTVSKTRRVLIALILVSAVKNIHYVWTAEFAYNPKSGAAMCVFGLFTRTIWVQIYQWFDTCVASAIPFLVLIVMNCAIIVALRRQSQVQAEIADADSAALAKSRERQITGMLLSVSFMFVILTSPLFIFRTYFTFVSRSSSPKMEAIYHMGHHICHKLWYTNNAINFYLYCLTGAKFRKGLAKMFKCGRMSKAMSTSSIQTTQTTSVSTVNMDDPVTDR